MVDPRYVDVPNPMPQNMYLKDPAVKQAVPASVAFAQSFKYYSQHIVNEFHLQEWFYATMPKIVMTDSLHVGKATLEYNFLRTTGTSAATPRDWYATVPSTYTQLASETATIGNLATSVTIERDFNRFGGAVNQWAFQLQNAKDGIARTFNDMVVRGNPDAPKSDDDKAVGPGAFAGLDKIIRSFNHHVWPDTFDFTGLGDVMDFDPKTSKTKQAHMVVLKELQKFKSRLKHLNPKPQWILCNDDLINALSAAGDRMGSYQMQTYQVTLSNGIDDSEGPTAVFTVPTYDGVALISMGKRAGKPKEDIIKTGTSHLPTRENPGGDGNKTYETKAYAGSFGPNAVMGLVLPGDQVTFNGPFPVNDGWSERYNCEMFIGLVVHSRASVGLFDHIAIPEYLIEYPNYIDPVEPVLAAAA